MQVSGVKTEHVTIEISESEVKKILLNTNLPISLLISALRKSFKSKLGFGPDHYIKDNMWMFEFEEYGGSHSWFRTVEIRPVTQAELVYDDLLNRLLEAETAVELSKE